MPMMHANHNRGRNAFSMLLAGFMLFAYGCDRQEPQPPASKRERSAHLVSVMQASVKPVATRHTRTGTVTVRHLARIYAQEEGKIADFPWLEGDRVTRGTLLVSLDDTLIRAELKKAQADARQAELDLKRIRNLIKKKAASDDELSRSLTAVSVNRAEVEILKTRLTYTKIIAPFDGLISERYVEPQDFVSKQTHLLTMINPDSLYIKANISELLLPQLDRDTPVEIQVDALGQEIFKGQIERVHPAIDPVTRQAVIEVGFTSLPENILSGQFARLTLKTRDIQRFLLPFNAIQHDRNGEFVYLLEQGKAVKTRIRSGIKIDDQIEILEGIKPGQQIITRGFLGLSDGKKVKPESSTTDS